MSRGAPGHNSRWQRWGAWILGLSLLAVAGVYGCNRAVDHAADRLAEPDIVQSTDPELMREATEFGGWVLPEDADVLSVRRQIVRERWYQIAVQTTPTGLALMLEQSRFPATLIRTGPPYFTTTIAGPPLETSPLVERAQEASFTSAEGTVMTREVTVDARDENTRFVHIEFQGL